MKKIYKYYAAALVAASLFGLNAQTANASQAIKDWHTTHMRIITTANVPITNFIVKAVV